MIDTRSMTPRVLSYKSRDFQLISKLLDLVANSSKLDIEYFPNLVNPEKCKSNWLEALASLVGYKYNDDLNAEQNRFIISNYRTLIMSRGSIRGIKLAVAIYLKLIGRSDSKFTVTVPTTDEGGLLSGAIYIDDEQLDVASVPLLVDLLELVRPVGVNYVIRKSITTSHDNELCSDQIVYTYQMKYPIDLTFSNEGVGTDRREVLTGSIVQDDSLNISDTPDIDNPDNVVGHNLVSKDETDEIGGK